MSELDIVTGLMYGLGVGALATGWYLNPWLKERILHNMGRSYKGFLFIFYKGGKVDQKSFDIREQAAVVGEKKYLIRPEHVYRIGGVPVAFAVSDNVSSVSMSEVTPQRWKQLHAALGDGASFKPDVKLEAGDKWLDPAQLFAYEVKQKTLVEARMNRDRGFLPARLRDALIIAAGLSALICLLLCYMILTNQGSIQEQLSHVAAGVNATRLFV